MKKRGKQFVIDGEAVILGVDGAPDFNALHSRLHDSKVQLYAFDCVGRLMRDHRCQSERYYAGGG